jgi:hypothetical protein
LSVSARTGGKTLLIVLAQDSATPNFGNDSAKKGQCKFHFMVKAA